MEKEKNKKIVVISIIIIAVVIAVVITVIATIFVMKQLEEPVVEEPVDLTIEVIEEEKFREVEGMEIPSYIVASDKQLKEFLIENKIEKEQRGFIRSYKVIREDLNKDGQEEIIIALGYSGGGEGLAPEEWFSGRWEWEGLTPEEHRLLGGWKGWIGLISKENNEYRLINWEDVGASITRIEIKNIPNQEYSSVVVTTASPTVVSPAPGTIVHQELFVYTFVDDRLKLTWNGFLERVEFGLIEMKVNYYEINFKDTDFDGNIEIVQEGTKTILREDADKEVKIMRLFKWDEGAKQFLQKRFFYQEKPVVEEPVVEEPVVEEPVDLTIEVIDRINNELDKADSEFVIAGEAIYRGDYEIAKTKIYNAFSYIKTAFRYYGTIEDKLTEADRTHWLTHFELYRTDFDLTLSTIDWFIDNDELIRLLDVGTDEELIIAYELHIRRTEELSESWNNYANKLEFIQRTQPDFGIADWEISDAREWASMFEEDAKGAQIFIDEFIALMPDFIPIDDRIIHPIVVIPPVSKEIIPFDLVLFFDGFDWDGNMELDLGEAQDFFYWVEDNIIYRWDDENRKDGWGFPVGDGRPDSDFVQTPHETWIERAGDCEDMAIIQVAFFNHFGISAYVASVNAEGREIDHAIAIAAIGGTPEEFADMLGGLVYYELEGGYYMLVDNAYSDAFGFLCGGLKEGQFHILLKLTLEEEMYKHRGIR